MHWYVCFMVCQRRDDSGRQMAANRSHDSTVSVNALTATTRPAAIRNLSFSIVSNGRERSPRNVFSLYFYSTELYICNVL